MQQGYDQIPLFRKELYEILLPAGTRRIPRGGRGECRVSVARRLRVEVQQTDIVAQTDRARRCRYAPGMVVSDRRTVCVTPWRDRARTRLRSSWPDHVVAMTIASAGTADDVVTS